MGSIADTPGRASIGERPLNVLHVVESWSPIISGYCTRGWAIVRAQADRPGLAAHVLVSSRQSVYGQGPAQTPPRMDRKVREVQPSARERRLRRWRPFDLDRRHLTRQIIAACEDWSIDLIHSHWSSGIGQASADAAEALGLPHVAEVRFDLAGAVTTETLPMGLPGVERSLRQYFERHLPRADRIVAASVSLAALLERTFAKLAQPVVAMPNGVDGLTAASEDRIAAVRAEHPLEGRCVVGTTSNMLRYEGLDRLIRALAQVDAWGARVHGLLVGSGPEHAALERLARKCKAPVTFTGRIPHDQVAAYLGAMDLFVVPRRDVSITRYAAPIKVVEAMAAGQAVIAAGVGDIPELLGKDRGLCLPPGAPGQLAEAIMALAPAPHRRRALGRAAARWAHRQPRWADLAERYESLYRDCGRHAQNRQAPQARRDRKAGPSDG